MKNPQIHLRDINSSLVQAWKEAFADTPVIVSEGDIFDNTSADAIISPSNSFGYMDGGIDMVYSLHFGWSMSAELRQQIHQQWGGELLVGQAAVVDIRPHMPNTEFKYLIAAPTMRVPMDVSQTVNAYLAFKAALRVATRHPEIQNILCPGLGTAIGLMNPEVCAKQMRFAWDELDATGMWHPRKNVTLREPYRDHWAMVPADLFMVKSTKLPSD